MGMNDKCFMLVETQQKNYDVLNIMRKHFIKVKMKPTYANNSSLWPIIDHQHVEWYDMNELGMTDNSHRWVS